MSDREISQSKFPKPNQNNSTTSKEDVSYFLNRFIRIMNLAHNSYSLSHPNIHTQLLDLELDIRKYQNNESATDNIWTKTTT